MQSAPSTAKGNRTIDRNVGQQLRGLRLSRGLSQGQVAERLGVTFQQVQKYEGGDSSLSVGRLCDLASVFDVPIDYFYDGLRGNRRRSLPDGLPDNPIELARTLRLIRYFQAIPDPTLRQSLLELAQSLAKGNY